MDKYELQRGSLMLNFIEIEQFNYKILKFAKYLKFKRHFMMEKLFSKISDLRNT